MTKIWFIAQGQTVRGPFSTEEIENFLLGGSINANTLIWWRGESSWHTVAMWKSRLTEILKSFEPKEEVEWFVQHGTESWGPLPISDVLKTLENAFDPTVYRLWKVGLERWQSIYHFDEICQHLGIRKRGHLRVPLMGTATLELPYDTVIVDTLSISEGGFGIVKTPLSPGHIVRATIKAPALPVPVRVHAEVRYSNRDGYTGLQFENLTPELKSAVMDYIRNFQKKTA